LKVVVVGIELLGGGLGDNQEIGVSFSSFRVPLRATYSLTRAGMQCQRALRRHLERKPALKGP
jgi:hypothetical protein